MAKAINMAPESPPPSAEPVLQGGHVFEHTHLADERGGETQSGSVFAHEFEHLFAVVVAASSMAVILDVHHLVNHRRVRAVDGELQPLFEKGSLVVLTEFSGSPARRRLAAIFGKLHDLFDQMHWRAFHLWKRHFFR